MSTVRRIAPPLMAPARRVGPPAAARRLGEPPRVFVPTVAPAGPAVDRVGYERPYEVEVPSALLLAPSTVEEQAFGFAAPGQPYRSSDLATGRGLTYEWEFFLAEVLDRLHVVELQDGGPSTGTAFVFEQAAPAATWTIAHGLGTKPVVAIVSTDGDLLFAEVHYPSDSTIVIIFGQPYAGTAYLRG